MALIRGFSALLVSLVARISASMVLFVLLARHWGASQFGQFTYVFSIAALLVLVCEFGFTQQVLRDVGRKPEVAAETMGAFFGAKIWLTGAIVVFSIFFVFFSSLDLKASATLLILLVAALLLSYADFFFACYRALGHYESESLVTVQGNLLYFIFGAFSLYLNGSPVFVAAALLLARFFQLLLVSRKFRIIFTEKIHVDFRFRSAISVIRTSAPFGAEVATAAIYMNADTLLVTHVLGYAANGIYQAAARFYQGACQLPPIFSSLFLPRMARDQNDADVFSGHIKRLYCVMISLGSVCVVGFAFSPYFISYIYTDASLVQASKLLPWFGLLLFIRYVAAAQGITITVLNGQVTRVWMLGATMGLMVLSAFPLMDKFGVVGMIIACILANLFLSAGFWFWAERRDVYARGILMPVHFGFVVAIVGFFKFAL